MARLRTFFNKCRHQDKTELVPMRITARVPVPLDPGRPSLAQLPDDVVLLVFSFIDDIGLRTMASLCSALYEKARRVQHHTVHIHMDKRRQARGRLDVLSRNLLLPAVRVLEVSGSSNIHQGEGQGNENEDEILTPLADMLLGMTGLRDLHWRSAAPIPRALINHVPTHTRLHTFVEVEQKKSHDQVRAFLAQLIDNQNLFSLSVNIGFEDEQVCRVTMHGLKQVLLSCPHLARIPRLGVYNWPKPGAPYCGLGLSGGERPPALEELGCSGYPWGREPTIALLNDLYARRDPAAMHFTGYPEKGFEWHYWAENFDWSRLRKLNSVLYLLALEIAPKLTALKEVDITWENAHGATFLEQIPTALERLTIPSLNSVGKKLDPITRHGVALRKLTIHCREGAREADSLVTNAYLIGLRDGLPHLVELAIDVSRDKTGNTWPYSTLDIIASFPCLQSVKLWFEVGRANPIPIMPYVTVSTIRPLFAYLRKRNRNIQHLELCSGSPTTWCYYGKPQWESLWGYHWGHDPRPDWDDQNSIRLMCEVSLCDGDAADGFVRVTCPDLSTEMNAELSRLAKENRERRRGLAEDATRLLLEVALDGPFTRDEWEAWKALMRVHYKARQEALLRQRPLYQRFRSAASKYLKYAGELSLELVFQVLACMLKVAILLGYEYPRNSRV